MKQRMSEAETGLLEAFLNCSHHYVEFGSGGSTCTAASLVRTSVLSVDSSEQWISKVRSYCASTATKIMPTFLHVDIGAIGDWGTPLNLESRASWPAYHQQLWTDPGSAAADLYLVDGRFRVACFMQIILHCDVDAAIMVHDFTRKHYQIIREVAREIAVVGELSVFQPLKGGFRKQAREILLAHEFVWA